MSSPTTHGYGRLLSVEEAAQVLGTTPRFPRRLIEERRVTFVRVGRHVRIPESALVAFIAANTVTPARGKAVA
jgi:excisionase family DNA binding protein